jgi:two-component system NtrC family sensor kinase
MEFDELVSYLSKLKVLYVEDYEDTREQLVKIFSDIFKEIVTAVDGLDGFNKFQKGGFDLVITDISMPNKNGIELINDIKKIDKNIPIIIFSAHSDTDYLIDAIKLNVDSFLIKPLDVEQLLDGLKKIVKDVKYKEAIKKEMILKDKILIQQTKLALMGEMIDAIAHQWRQPLNAIGSVTSNLIFKSRLELPINSETLLESSTNIEEQVIFMNETLDEFRTFFRPGKDIDYVNIFQVIESIKKLLKDSIIKNSLNIEFVGDKNLTVLINENEIKHVFINLINNSKDEFNKNKLEDRKIIIDTRESNDDILIMIRDNAGGIEKTVLPKVFEANITTKKEIGGSGVGLYMTRHIVYKNEGTIKVDSCESGALFTMNFKKREVCKI